MTSDPGAAQEHDGSCVSNFALEELLWEQQEQLEREMVEARRMVSSLQVSSLFICIYLTECVHLEITDYNAKYILPATKLSVFILWIQSARTKMRSGSRYFSGHFSK